MFLHTETFRFNSNNENKYLRIQYAMQALLNQVPKLNVLYLFSMCKLLVLHWQRNIENSYTKIVSNTTPNYFISLEEYGTM